LFNAAVVRVLQVARRKGPDGKLLSMGYGFVETDSEAAANTAIKQLQVETQCWQPRQLPHAVSSVIVLPLLCPSLKCRPCFSIAAEAPGCMLIKHTAMCIQMCMACTAAALTSFVTVHAKSCKSVHVDS
jgi:hypothetical protein